MDNHRRRVSECDEGTGVSKCDEETRVSKCDEGNSGKANS